MGVRLSVMLVLIGAVLGGLSACGRGTPSGPDASAGAGFLGTWTGTVVSAAIGKGGATLVLDSEIAANTTRLLTGRWTFAFANPTFDSQGTVSANVDASGAGLVVFFDRGTVPCPGEPGRVAQQTIVARVSQTGNRLHGDYIAGACPGGTLDVARR